MIFFEIILAMGVLGWLFMALIFVAFGSAVYTLKYNNVASGVWTFALVALLVFVFRDPLLAFGKSFLIEGQLDVKALTVFALKVIGVWLVGSLLAGFFYWVSFIYDVRNRFEDAFDEWAASLNKNQKAWSDRAKLTVARALACGDERKNIFLDRDWHGFRFGFLKGERYSGNSYLHDSYDKLDVNPTITTATVNIGGVDETTQIENYDQLDQIDQAVAEVFPPKYKQYKAKVIFAATIWPVTLVALLVGDLARQIVTFLSNFFGGFLDRVSKAIVGDLAASTTAPK